MIKLSSLNGWQRLFVAFLIFVYVPIAAISVVDRTYLEELTDKEFLKQVPTDLLMEMKSGRAVFINQNDRKPWDEYVGTYKFVMYEYNLAYSWRFTLGIDANIDSTKATDMAERLGNALNADYKTKMLMARGKRVAFFLLVAVAIYAFGWTLGWIYRGFKKNKE
jgi:hypothetical protein